MSSWQNVCWPWIKAECYSIFCDKATNQNLPWQAILPRCLTPRPPPTRRGNPWLGHSGRNWTHPLQKKRGRTRFFCRKIDAVAAFENLAATAESRQDLLSKPLTNEFWANQSILLLQDNPAVGLNNILLPSVLGCHKNLHQVVDPSCLQVLEHYCRLE